MILHKTYKWNEVWIQAPRIEIQKLLETSNDIKTQLSILPLTKLQKNSFFSLDQSLSIFHLVSLVWEATLFYLDYPSQIVV